MYKSLLLMIIFFGAIFQISAQNRQVMLNAGTYSALTTYSASDVVLEGNSYYISLIANNNNNDPASSPTDWKLIGNSFTATGDLGGTSTSQTVLGLTHVTNAAIPVNLSAPSASITGNISGGGVSVRGSGVTYPDSTVQATKGLLPTNNLADVASSGSARSNITAAKSGANADITALSGLTTPLSPALGGAGAMTSAPAWLRFFGDGSQGAYSCATGTCGMNALESWYSSFNVSAGATLSPPNGNGAQTIIRSTGPCTIAGITASAINDAIRQVVAGEMLTTTDQVILIGGAQ